MSAVTTAAMTDRTPAAVADGTLPPNLTYLSLVTIRGPEEPQVVFAQPELPLQGVETLSAIQSVELWLARNGGADDDLNVVTAQLYLSDSESRLARARRWLLVREINERCTHDWGVLVHGGTESVWLLDEAAQALVDGLWLAALLCCHSACERHLAGILSMDEGSLHRSWRSWGLGRLLDEAQQRDIVPSDLREPLNQMNEVRKASAHFKPPLYDGSLMRRAIAINHEGALESVEALAEADAFAAYETAKSLVHRARFA